MCDIGGGWGYPLTGDADLAGTPATDDPAELPLTERLAVTPIPMPPVADAAPARAGLSSSVSRMVGIPVPVVDLDLAFLCHLRVGWDLGGSERGGEDGSAGKSSLLVSCGGGAWAWWAGCGWG
jgi:hypothetical protein